MTVSELMKKMIDASEGNLHDINHFVKVWGYAKTIGELEGIPSETQFILECAAIMHDIACPLCRRKYGNTNGTYQEKEGMPLGRALLADTDLTDAEKERIVFLIGHHHTCTDVNGMDYQILLEADYLVNADESAYSAENIEAFRTRVFRTESGKRLLDSMYRERLAGRKRLMKES